MDEFDRIIYMDALKAELEEVGELSIPPLPMYMVSGVAEALIKMEED
jgi:hypothetical protein